MYVCLCVKVYIELTGLGVTKKKRETGLTNEFSYASGLGVAVDIFLGLEWYWY